MDQFVKHLLKMHREHEEQEQQRQQIDDHRFSATTPTTPGTATGALRKPKKVGIAEQQESSHWFPSDPRATPSPGLDEQQREENTYSSKPDRRIVKLPPPAAAVNPAKQANTVFDFPEVLAVTETEIFDEEENESDTAKKSAPGGYAARGRGATHSPVHFSAVQSATSTPSSDRFERRPSLSISGTVSPSSSLGRSLSNQTLMKRAGVTDNTVGAGNVAGTQVQFSPLGGITRTTSPGPSKSTNAQAQGSPTKQTVTVLPKVPQAVTVSAAGTAAPPGVLSETDRLRQADHLDRARFLAQQLEESCIVCTMAVEEGWKLAHVAMDERKLVQAVRRKEKQFFVSTLEMKDFKVPNDVFAQFEMNHQGHDTKWGQALHKAELCLMGVMSTLPKMLSLAGQLAVLKTGGTTLSLRENELHSTEFVTDMLRSKTSASPPRRSPSQGRTKPIGNDEAEVRGEAGSSDKPSGGLFTQILNGERVAHECCPRCNVRFPSRYIRTLAEEFSKQEAQRRKEKEARDREEDEREKLLNEADAARRRLEPEMVEIPVDEVNQFVQVLDRYAVLKKQLQERTNEILSLRMELQARDLALKNRDERLLQQRNWMLEAGNEKKMLQAEANSLRTRLEVVLGELRELKSVQVQQQSATTPTAHSSGNPSQPTTIPPPGFGSPHQYQYQQVMQHQHPPNGSAFPFQGTTVLSVLDGASIDSGDEAGGEDSQSAGPDRRPQRVQQASAAVAVAANATPARRTSHPVEPPLRSSPLPQTRLSQTASERSTSNLSSQLSTRPLANGESSSTMFHPNPHSQSQSRVSSAAWQAIERYRSPYSTGPHIGEADESRARGPKQERGAQELPTQGVGKEKPRRPNPDDMSDIISDPPSEQAGRERSSSVDSRFDPIPSEWIRQSVSFGPEPQSSVPVSGSRHSTITTPSRSSDSRSKRVTGAGVGTGSRRADDYFTPDLGVYHDPHHQSTGAVLRYVD